MNKKENIEYTNLPIISLGKILKKQDKEKQSSKILTILLVIFIIILLLLSGYSMAKTMEEVILKANTQIAEPILIIENNPSIDITAANNCAVYSFKIKNFNDKGKITETDLKYYIEILSNIDDSINIELFENQNEINMNNNKTEYIQIGKEQKQEREYKIKITYDKNKSNSTKDILEKIQVKVHTEQIKA